MYSFSTTPKTQLNTKTPPATSGQVTRVTETQSNRFDVEPRDPAKQTMAGIAHKVHACMVDLQTFG